MIITEVKEVGNDVNDNNRVGQKFCFYYEKALIYYDRQVNHKVVKLCIKPIRFSFQNELKF